MSIIQWFFASFLMLAVFVLSGCGDESGPGMTVTWKSKDSTNEIWLKSIRYPSGVIQKRSSLITVRSPKVEGFAPDNRIIPEWVELSWIEPKDYENDASAPSTEDQLNIIHQLPLKTQRLEVGSRIPKDVVAQAVEAVKNRRPSELPDKHIWIYFVWHQGQVSFRWELLDRTLEAGGKVIASGN